MHRFRNIFFSFIFALMAAGCASVGPQYSASIENVQTLKDAGTYAANVGTFASSADKGNANPISIRGSSIRSPYQDSYANYIAEAIRQELALATKLNASSSTEISGTLLKNDVDATGFSVGVAEIAARFTVKKNGQICYDQLKSVRHEFPSSFAGAIAIPRAIQEYTSAVQKLLASLYADKDFLTALK